jgi:hypothetical protein
MKKLRLEIEEIQVETFEVAEDTHGRGTVQGHQPTVGDTCSCDCSADDVCSLDVCTGYAHSCNFTDCYGTRCILYCPWESVDVC